MSQQELAFPAGSTFQRFLLQVLFGDIGNGGVCGYLSIRECDGLKGLRSEREREMPSHPSKDPGLAGKNVLERAFAADSKNQAWVGGMTHTKASQGFLCLAAMADAFSRKIVGWAASGRIRESPVVDAMSQAMPEEKPSPGLLAHAGRGPQHASYAFDRLSIDNGLAQSMSRKGNPHGNAVSEPFYETLKRELVRGAKHGTRIDGRQEMFKCIELCCNRKRKHSSLGHMSPVDYERQNIQKTLT